MSNVVLIEKRDEIRQLLEKHFAGRFAIERVPTLRAAQKKFKDSDIQLLIWNAPSGGAKGSEPIDSLPHLTKYFPKTAALIIADCEEPDFLGIRETSYYWIRSPFEETELAALVERILDRQAFSGDGPEPTSEIAVPIEFEGILAVSLIMRSVIQQIIEAAAEDIPVLITGETGTGKDLVAAAIHKRSKRKDAPYLPVNMGAISSELIASELFGHEKGAYTGAIEARGGYFEQAQGGTIFLDEITTMDEKTQVSLLRVLETKTLRRVRGDKDIKVNVRVIAASNENVEEVVKAGRFREDLYYRLDVFRIHLPPLRERPGGVSLLTDHFVARFDELYSRSIRVVSPETYRLLRRYQWPGNVRELKNVIQRAVLLAKSAELTPDLLPLRISEREPAGETDRNRHFPLQVGMSLADVEKEFIKMTLASVSGNKMKASSILGISRRALYNKLKRFGLL